MVMSTGAVIRGVVWILSLPNWAGRSLGRNRIWRNYTGLFVEGKAYPDDATQGIYDRGSFWHTGEGWHCL